MKSNIILLLMLSAYVLLPILAYRMQHRRMAQFCFYMTVSENVRKFYCYMLLLSVIIFHAVYYNTNNAEWGLMVSTIPMLMMFSVRWLTWFLQRLRDYRRELLAFTVYALIALFTPHLFTLGITFFVIIVGVAFYPSRIIQGIDKYLLSAQYSRAMITRNYSKIINCYFE